jgi:hypothetical protein
MKSYYNPKKSLLLPKSTLTTPQAKKKTEKDKVSVHIFLTKCRKH